VRLIGNDPWQLGDLHTPAGWDEFCFVQDMPIALAGDIAVHIPPEYAFAYDFVMMVGKFLHTKYGDLWSEHRNFYLSLKHTMVPKGQPQTRPGWHTDGYGTDDLAFLWCDAVPTLFLKQAMRVSENDERALSRMNEFADVTKSEHGLPGRVYGMDDTVIHAPSSSYHLQPRRFMKLSVSRYAYDLKGNARNRLLPTEWQPTRERGVNRNQPENRG